jgi:restriction endonuclease S subunit
VLSFIVLFFYLNSSLFQKPLILVSDRSAQSGFSKEDISPFEIPIPPLPEQKRIVAILDEAFEGIDRATMQNLSNQSLSDLVIAMPSLDEQNQITNKTDDLKSEIQHFENIYRQKIAALKELKQSILQKAFTGELTADKGITAMEEKAA